MRNLGEIMKDTRKHAFASTLFLLAATLIGATGLMAQTPPPAPPTTAVLATLALKPGVNRPEIMNVLKTEVRETMKLYLDGKITQWYSRSEGRGVLFFVNATTVEEAKAIMDTLPLAKAELVTTDYIALSPLEPMRMLVAQPPTSAKP